MVSTTTFQERVYARLREVPKGTVTTYADVAHALGIRSARAVGQALRANPYAPQVPCHRVVTSDGRIGGFMGARQGSQISKKIQLLRAEGIIIIDDKIHDFALKRHIMRQS